MPDLRSPELTIYLLQLLVSGFIAVLFLQSGLDKVFDRAGNRAYLDEHFGKSPLARTVGPMFLTITVLEVAAGVLSGLGLLQLLFLRSSSLAFYGALIATANIVALFFGQRVSKDYAGAAALVPYFLLGLVGIVILAQPIHL